MIHVNSCRKHGQKCSLHTQETSEHGKTHDDMNDVNITILHNCGNSAANEATETVNLTENDQNDLPGSFLSFLFSWSAQNNKTIKLLGCQQSTELAILSKLVTITFCI